jgi:hypothetical protein
MNGWTLEQVRALTISEYRTLVAMITEEAERLERART